MVQPPSAIRASPSTLSGTTSSTPSIMRTISTASGRVIQQT